MLKISNRIRQFYLYATDKMNKEDKTFVEKYLDNGESKLFYKLSSHTQKHSVRVAYDIKKICINDVCNKSIKCNFLIKIGLLHDIGKINSKINLFDRCALVVLDNITKGKLKKLNGIKKICVYYNHAEEGYEMLKKLGYDDKMLYVIKNHHNTHINNNVELNILKLCDKNN